MSTLFRKRKIIIHENDTLAKLITISDDGKDHKKSAKWNYRLWCQNRLFDFYKHFKCKCFCKCNKIILWILLTFLFLITFVYYGHYLTCYITIQLCTPFHFYLRILHSHILQNTAMDQISFQNTLYSVYQKANNTANDICADKLLKNPCSEKLKLGILLSQRHGGSSWIIQELNKNPYIIGFREKLEVWENNNCALFAKIENIFTLNSEHKKECNSETLLLALHNIYNAFFAKIMDRNGCNDTVHNGKSYKAQNTIFWKLQMDQLHSSMFQTLIDFVYCNDIMIVQIIRLSTIEAFLSYQMSTVERVSTMEFEKIFKHKRINPSRDYVMSDEPILIDPSLAETYVRKMDQNRKYIRQLIEYYPFEIAYIQFKYEDLIGVYKKKYWKAMFSFIGLTYKEMYIEPGDALIKKHSLPCHKKISNWNEVKQYLVNTSSYWICEKN